MATVQVILAGQLRTTIHDAYDYPLVLQFGDKRSYEEAEWVIASYPRHIPARRVSEIRVDNGTFTILIDGPEGFRHGPYTASWVRGYYPRGKHCAFLHIDPDTHTMSGVTLTTVEGSLVISDWSLGEAMPPSEN